jgi:hypothetical protein
MTPPPAIAILKVGPRLARSATALVSFSIAIIVQSGQVRNTRMEDGTNVKRRRWALGVVYLICGAAETLLLLRILLKLLAARSEESFANIVYSLSAPLVFPFPDRLPDWQSLDHTLESASFLAMLIVFLIAYIGTHLLQLNASRARRASA